MFNGEIRPKCGCFIIVHSTTKNIVYQHKYLMPNVKFSGGGVMIRTCFAASGPEYLTVMESTMHSLVYQIFLSNVRPFVPLIKMAKTESCNRKVIPSTTANLQTIGWKRKESKWVSLDPNPPENAVAGLQKSKWNLCKPHWIEQHCKEEPKFLHNNGRDW